MGGNLSRQGDGIGMKGSKGRKTVGNRVSDLTCKF